MKLQEMFILLHLKTLAIILAALGTETGTFRWEKWSWSEPQEPITYYFRRHQNMPVKSPDFHCDCPPNRECEVEYKINEDVAEFLDMRGLLKEGELDKLKEDITKVKETEEPLKKNSTKTRRSASDAGEEGCCCPPRNVMMPTIITENKFNKTLNRLTKLNQSYH